MPPRRFLWKLLVAAVLMVTPLFLLLALLWPTNRDFIFYATGLNFFSAQLWSGDVYPRWLMATNDGFGSPVFLFYPPGGFYAASLLQWLAPFDPHGFGRIAIGMMLALFVAGITSYRWLSKHLSADNAQRGALVYATFPYIVMDIYYASGLSQAWAVALFPFLLEAASDVAAKGWRGVPKLALGYGILCMTHVPSIILFCMVPFIYSIVLAPQKKYVSRMIMATAASGLGIALSAIYLLPFKENISSISINRFTEDHFFYANNFFHMQSIIGFCTLILPIIVFYMELPKAMQKHIPMQVRFWLIATLVLFLIATPLATPLWEWITPLQYVQFPFRLFYAAMPGVAFVAAYWLGHVKTPYLYSRITCIMMVFPVCVALHILVFPKITWLNAHPITPVEYHTPWMNAAGFNPPDLPEPYRSMPPVLLVKGSGTAEILAQTSRSITLHADIASPSATLSLHRFYFPGWVSTPETIAIEPKDALVSLVLPHGAHDITLEIPWFAGERMGMMISAAALCIIFIGMIGSRLRPLPEGHINSHSAMQL